MKHSYISDEAALRVALASRLLPDIHVSSLLGLLVQHLGEPLSESALEGLSPKAFRIMIGSLDTKPTHKDVTNALVVLTNSGTPNTEAPIVPSLPPLHAPKINVAITSNQGEMINGHYGSCMRVLIYEVNDCTHQLIDVRYIQSDLKGEERSKYMVKLIGDCQLLFTLSIGGPAAARVTRANIHPIKETTPIVASEVLSELSMVLKNNPPPWLKKIMELSCDQTFSLAVMP